MSESGKHYATLLLVTVLVTILAGIVVYYVGSSLPSGLV